MLTLQNLRDVVTQSIGGGNPSLQWPPDPATLPTTTADSVRDMWINSAGRFLTSMHDWRFRQRPPIVANLINGQKTIILPPDCGQVDGARMTNSVISQITIVGLPFIESLRSGLTSTGTTDFWVALAFKSQPNAQTQPLVPHLEVFPTPNADDIGGITLIYKANWTRLVQSDDVANIPEYMDNLMWTCVRAFALGIGESENGDVDQRLGAINQGVIFKTAREEDGLQLNTGAQMSGGQMQPPLESHSYSWRWLTNSPVSDPT